MVISFTVCAIKNIFGPTIYCGMALIKEAVIKDHEYLKGWDFDLNIVSGIIIKLPFLISYDIHF